MKKVISAVMAGAMALGLVAFVFDSIAGVMFHRKTGRRCKV